MREFRYLVLASVLPAGLLHYFQVPRRPHSNTGTGLAPPPFVPGLGSPLPLPQELYRIVITAEEADESSEKYTQHRCHICTRTGLAPATSAPRLGTPLPHLRRVD